MKALYWNARGFGNEDTKRAFRRMVRLHRPSFVCISEPFVLISSIPVSFWRSLGLVPLTTNNRGLQDPNIWILCHVDFRFQVLSSTEQQITISGIIEGTSCVLTIVYAKTTISGRRILWNELMDINENFVHGPWLVFGDFNCIFGAHEKRGGNVPSLTSCTEFQQMCTNCGLIDIETKGLSYTWSNGRTTVRLDRSLGNLDWIEAWPLLECRTLTKATSDHCPLLITFSKLLRQARTPFRFQSMWLQHQDFIPMVRDFWCQLQYAGCPMFVLAAKLRALKVFLKNWNKTTFGDVNQRVEDTKAALDDIQREISIQGPSSDLFHR